MITRMMSIHQRRSARGAGAYKPDLESPTAVIEVRNRLASVRGLRDAMAQLAGFLTEDRHRQAILLLVEPKMTACRVMEEWGRFKTALRPDIGERLRILVFRDGNFIDEPADLHPNDWRLLKEAIAMETEKNQALRQGNLQSEVLRVMIHQWILGRGPMTFRWLQETVDCSYRTAAAVVERLGPAIRRHSDRRIELKYFPKDAWAKLVAVSDDVRGTLRYVDRSDQPRSVESLFKRLEKMDRSDVGIGGVLGAKHYYPDLDILGSHRLDLTLHCPGKRVDLEFVHRLDPGLEQSRDSRFPAPLVLHFLRRKEPLFDADGSRNLWADPVECLLDLHESRLEPQAMELMNGLTSQRIAPE